MVDRINQIAFFIVFSILVSLSVNSIKSTLGADDANSQYEKARKMYQGAEGENCLREEALALLKQATKDGSLEAQALLAYDYLTRPNSDKRGDYASAKEYAEKSAQAGVALGNVVLGDLYAGGLGVAKSESEANRYYESAFRQLKLDVEQGNSTAMNELARLYANGLGVPEDLAAAVEWYRKAADLKNFEAMLKLGRLYRDGEGVTKDEREAFQWFRKSSGAQDVVDKNRANLSRTAQEVKDNNGGEFGGDQLLGLVIFSGLMADDPELNAKGLPQALEELASYYETGTEWGVDRDEVKAFRCWKNAADRGRPHAAYKVGVCYRDGLGTSEKSDEKALYYFKRAAWLGDENGMNACREMRKTVSSSSSEPNSSWDSSKTRKAGTRQTLRIGDADYGFVWIPAGKFKMGSPLLESGRLSNERRHKVILSHGFWMCETETTQGLWREVAGDDQYVTTSSADKPVEARWYDCEKFILFLNANDYAPKGMEFCLPTEAEWEYACRAGAEDSGIKNLDETCWYSGNTPLTVHFFEPLRKEAQKVGSKRPNAWGLYDMHGNVSEWCEVWFDEYPWKKTLDPQGPDLGSEKVHRGGDFRSSSSQCRSATRGSDKPGSAYRGFRIVLKEKH